jgi:hypothetical protein
MPAGPPPAITQRVEMPVITLVVATSSRRARGFREIEPADLLDSGKRCLRHAGQREGTHHEDHHAEPCHHISCPSHLFSPSMADMFS